ncbi:tyrosine--tRNA ligase [Candidatus Saccharibacteria bacterium]|nr:tyrosine--tRNA ligase [Candidatus Saccharibacteria bacterium]
MKLSEELIWRGFSAKTTLKDPSELDSRESKKFYWGADPSADSLTIGNLAALMMCACFVRHGYQPYLLVGGATGQIGDPKENGERELKSLEEVEFNKSQIKSQISRIINSDSAVFLDNLDWFKDIKFLPFLREVGKSFSMTQLLDRQFVQNRIGEGGSGISYAEFSYTLIQGYDFLHLYRKYGVSLELCGADQYGNCASGIHLIKRLENANADVWSTPLVIDPVSGKKFGKSEGNAVWLASAPVELPKAQKSQNSSNSSETSENSDSPESPRFSENFTPVFDFYQFWLNQPDSSVEYLLKIYTLIEKPELEALLAEHKKSPEKRLAQRALAFGATSVVHGESSAKDAEFATDFLFSKTPDFSESSLKTLKNLLGSVSWGESETLLDILVKSGLSSSKSEARKLLKSGAVSYSGEKLSDESFRPSASGVLKRGKNKFAVID